MVSEQAQDVEMSLTKPLLDVAELRRRSSHNKLTSLDVRTKHGALRARGHKVFTTSVFSRLKAHITFLVYEVN
jgi:hypothetical protein